MLQFTHGQPDEMQVWIACGIAAYLILFPLVIVTAAVLGAIAWQPQPGGQAAVSAPDAGPAAAPARQRGVAAAAPCPVETAAGAAA